VSSSVKNTARRKPAAASSSRSADRAGFSACCRNKAAFAEKRRGFFRLIPSRQLSSGQVLYFVSILQPKLFYFAGRDKFLLSDINLPPMICLHQTVGALILGCNK
jgi:hypothetical protein